MTFLTSYNPSTDSYNDCKRNAEIQATLDKHLADLVVVGSYLYDRTSKRSDYAILVLKAVSLSIARLNENKLLTRELDRAVLHDWVLRQLELVRELDKWAGLLPPHLYHSIKDRTRDGLLPMSQEVEYLLSRGLAAVAEDKYHAARTSTHQLTDE